MAAFEYASRVGERERSQFLGLSAAKFLKAARMLGAVDDGTSLTSRCDSDLVFIEATRSISGEKLMPFKDFVTAMSTLALRKFPACASGAAALNALINAAPAIEDFARFC